MTVVTGVSVVTQCFHDLYKGIVTNNVDPEGYARIKAIVPQVFGNATTETDWAWPVFPSGWGSQSHASTSVTYYNNGNPGTTAGSVSQGGGFTGDEGTPIPGVGVWISFEGGDIDHPIWHGVWGSRD